MEETPASMSKAVGEDFGRCGNVVNVRGPGERAGQGRERKGLAQL